MSLKNSVKYLGFTLVVLGLLCVTLVGYYKCDYLFSMTYRSFYYFFGNSIYVFGAFVIGLLLGTDALFQNKKEGGHWRVNISKMIFVGLPFLLISLWYPSMFLTEGSIPMPMTAVTMLTTGGITPLAALIAGYALITSFEQV